MSEAGDFDDDGWRPPTEAELKVIEARRERSDKISKIMGQYLLKGHKMLDQTCPRCTCILLQMKGSSDLHCVSCIDLDSETKKDDPALNLAAASATVNEGNLRGYQEAASSSSTSSESSTTSASRGTQLQQTMCTRSNTAPSKSSHQIQRESIEEHSGSCIVPLECLTRSQLTAVHDIPASEALAPPVTATQNIPYAANLSKIPHPASNRLSNSTMTLNHQADYVIQDCDILIGAKRTLKETIETLSQQLNEVNEELRQCPKSNSSKLNTLLELVAKYSTTLSAILQAYNHIAST